MIFRSREANKEFAARRSGYLGIRIVAKKQHAVKKRNSALYVVIAKVIRINCFLAADYMDWDGSFEDSFLRTGISLAA